jgi:hypothetical protein
MQEQLTPYDHTKPHWQQWQNHQIPQSGRRFRRIFLITPAALVSRSALPRRVLPVVVIAAARAALNRAPVRALRARCTNATAPHGLRALAVATTDASHRWCVCSLCLHWTLR